jgi:pimeloyl-ACP methyl ester carboxylesterase
MKLLHHALIALICSSFQAQAQNGSPVVLPGSTGSLYGTLLLPDAGKPVPVVLMIAGSGPTDRNGNNMMMTNNCTKLLAEALFRQNIATVRYDKRGIGESKDAGKKEEDLRFDNYVNDAAAWITLLKNDKRFSNVIVFGHSEGSLIGMVAAQTTKADGFISAAGAGFPADEILKKQLKAQPPAVYEMVAPILDSLKAGKQVKNVNPMLNALARPSIQPYMISWFKYDPRQEISKLTIPVLIVQGTTDIQVSEEDARALASANPKAKLVLIEKMNHILKEAEADRAGNIATYNNPALPVAPELVKHVVDFTPGH